MKTKHPTTQEQARIQRAYEAGYTLVFGQGLEVEIDDIKRKIIVRPPREKKQ